MAAQELSPMLVQAERVTYLAGKVVTEGTGAHLVKEVHSLLSRLAFGTITEV